MRVTDTRPIRVILLDIEGTTTPVDFVYKTLFPYASRNLESFLRRHFADPDIQPIVANLRTLHQRDTNAGEQTAPWRAEAELESTIAYLRWLISRDSKCTPLKTLQGKIWEQGYRRGDLRGDVYEDVPRALARWQRQERKVAIYSSGSILAQRLLFQFTQFGNLTSHLSGFFDTQTGPKTEAESYKKIATALQQPPSELLFVSDANKEIEAAQLAGLQTALCIRGGTESGSPLAATSSAISTFDELLPD